MCRYLQPASGRGLWSGALCWRHVIDEASLLRSLTRSGKGPTSPTTASREIAVGLRRPAGRPDGRRWTLAYLLAMGRACGTADDRGQQERHGFAQAPRAAPSRWTTTASAAGSSTGSPPGASVVRFGSSGIAHLCSIGRWGVADLIAGGARRLDAGAVDIDRG